MSIGAIQYVTIGVSTGVKRRRSTTLAMVLEVLGCARLATVLRTSRCEPLVFFGSLKICVDFRAPPSCEGTAALAIR